MSTREDFGARTTTDEVLDGIELGGRQFMITGATSGLGEESTRALAAHGASVTMLGRDDEKLEAAQARVRSQVPDANLRLGNVDLSDLASIRAFAAEYVGGSESIDVLINNAGVMACPELRTADGFEMQFGTNHLGHFLLTNLLLPSLLGGDEPRVVNLSSGSHGNADVDLDDPNFERTEYDPWVAYGRSKTANVLFTRELARRLDGRLLAFAVHPGVIQTELVRHVPEETLAGMFEQVRDRMKTIEAGAATQIWAATAPELASHSGVYLANCQLGVVGSETKKVGVREYAYDADNARRLWELSEQLVGGSDPDDG
jgi:NAD(P)-dependent dehydrogenase (short-subunit alcohol dehydrogenase family)